jgi:hypothetical protein
MELCQENSPNEGWLAAVTSNPDEIEPGGQVPALPPARRLQPVSALEIAVKSLRVTSDDSS